MISLTNHDFQWGRSEVVTIYPDWVTQPWLYIPRFPVGFLEADQSHRTWSWARQVVPKMEICLGKRKTYEGSTGWYMVNGDLVVINDD
jgi:hypothetical protein